jgi:hypothetical protein
MKATDSIVCVFCEDLREDLRTVVGIYPDNVSFPKVPVVFPKLAIYARGHFLVSAPPKTFTLELVTPWNQTMKIGEMNREAIDSAIDSAQKIGKPTIGLIIGSIIAPFSVTSFGRMDAIATVGGEQFHCGALNFVQDQP